MADKVWILPPGKNMSGTYIDLWQSSSESLDDLKNNAREFALKLGGDGILDYSLSVTHLEGMHVLYTAVGIVVKSKAAESVSVEAPSS